MPHLVKSNDPSSFPPPPRPPTDAQVLQFRRLKHKKRSPSRTSHTLRTTRTSREWARAHEDLAPLRRQVTEIIDAILAGTGPAEYEVREQLRRLVASHPGRPEKALLKHLLRLSA